ncbi:MAG TPA: diguanylate cyclase [Candidatus Obscuribacterales bacterium]
MSDAPINSPLSAAGKTQFAGQEIDALRRHVCQILGFDIALIDIVRGSSIDNLITFYAEDGSQDITLDDFLDDNQQPLSNSNSDIAQTVRQQYTPYIGRVLLLDEAPPEDELRFPYVVVPISDGQGDASTAVKGLIRVVSFDNTRKIESSDIANVRLIGQHLATRIPVIADSEAAPQADVLPEDVRPTELIVVAHSNRAVRRRLSRTLSGDKYNVVEADDAQRVTQALRENEVGLLVLDSQLSNESGKTLCRSLKDSDSEFKHVPMIVVTPDTDSNSKVEGLNAGADDCVSENCIDAELLARVRASFRLKKTQRELATQLKLLEDYAQRLEYASEVERLASMKISKEKSQLDSLNQELTLKKREVEILHDQDNRLRRISDCIRKSFNIEDNIGEMLESLAGWLELDNCFVVLSLECDEQDIIRREYAAHEGYRLLEHGYDITLLDIFKSLPRQDLLLVNDVKRDKRVEPFKDVLSHYHLYSVFYVPITYENKLLGILGGHKCETQAQWTQHYETFFGQIADQLAIGVTNARLYKRVERQATTDGLTSLFNHRTGQEKLAEQLRLAERYQRNLAVVMIDIDHFKSINDTYGHPVGDSVLKAVARAIRRDCRDVDIPVRYGGEEFLLVLPEVNQEGAVVVAERLRKSLQREQIMHDEVQLSVTASIGVAAYPEDTESHHNLLELADKALYMSKRLGRNQVHTAADLLFHEFHEGQKQKQESEGAGTSAPGSGPDSVPNSNSGLNSNSVPNSSSVPAGASPLTSDGTADTTITANLAVNVTPPAATTPSPAVNPAQLIPGEDKEGLVPEVVEMVKAMAGALYAKSDYNKVHHLETARFAEMVAKVLGLNQRQIEQIRVAGLLHDVGLLSVPEEIVNKPGQVNADELRVLMQHPIMGAQMFRPIHALKEICDILENHHECWDGTGYPRGLKGEEIPLSARIISIVDSYHAMISDRPYRAAMSKEKAKRVLRNGAGTQFDPFLVDIFLACLSELEEQQEDPEGATT